MQRLPGLRFAAGILFICLGLASILHWGPAYLLWYSPQAIVLYTILLALGVIMLLIPALYGMAGANAFERAAVLRYDFAIVLSAVAVGFMLLLDLIFSNPYWQSLEWIPVVLAFYIVISSVLFSRTLEKHVARGERVRLVGAKS